VGQTEDVGWAASCATLPTGRIATLGGAQVVGLAAGLLTQLLAGRALSPSEYSSFATANLISLFSLVLLIGGVPLALRRLVSLHPERFGMAVGLLLRLQLPLGVAAGAAVAGARQPLAELFNAPALAPLFVVLAIEITIRAGFLEPCNHLLNGAGLFGAQAVVTAVYSAGRLLFIAVLLALGTGLSGAVAGLALAALIASTLATTIVARQGPIVFVPPATVNWSQDILHWIKYSCGYEVFSFLLVAMNLWIVKVMHPDDPQLGLYAAGTMISRASFPLAQALTGGTFAWIATAHAEGELGRVSEMLGQLSSALAVFVVPATLLAFLYGAELLEAACGPGYGGSSFLCGLLFAGTGLAATNLCLGEVLGASNRLTARLSVTVLVFVLDLPMTIVLTKFAGLEGSAWALLAGQGVLAVTLAALVRNAVGAFVPWRFFGMIAPAGLVMLSVRAVSGLPVGFLGLGLHVIMSLAAFALTLLLLQRISRVFTW
jgi:O-antigen/teichoic acid export membrane protein